jgi:hypothetical protein
MKEIPPETRMKITAKGRPNVVEITWGRFLKTWFTEDMPAMQEARGIVLKGLYKEGFAEWNDFTFVLGNRKS